MKVSINVLIIHIVAMLLLGALCWQAKIGEEVFCTLFGMLVGYWIGQGRGVTRAGERSSNSTS